MHFRLIGESDRVNMAYMGTSVNYGRGEMAVTNTGLRAEIGNIATMLMQVEEGAICCARARHELSRRKCLKLSRGGRNRVLSIGQ